jgi:WD40 repeat protein
MVIGRDKGKDGAPGARAAWPSAWAAMPGRGIRAGRCRARRGVIVMAAAGSLGLLAGLAAAPASGSVSGESIARPAPGTQLWVSRSSGPESWATSVVVSPGGGAVFVTGSSRGANGDDYATVAYNAATGAQRWASLYNGPGNNHDEARSVAVSPDGATVFVTGWSVGATSAQDYATVAYDAATGAQRWASRYNGPANQRDQAWEVAVSPDGRTVFVTGRSQGATVRWDYATVAYDAATGAQLWASRYNGPANLGDMATAVAVSPDGATVFVTGTSRGATSFDDYATVASAAATGAQRWASRYNARANRGEMATALAVGPGGHSVYVTGTSRGATSGKDYATIAYDAAAGARRWASRYNGPQNNDDSASSVAAGPGGHSVYVTGTTSSGTPGADYATVAYNAATGTRRWVRRYNGPQNRDDYAEALAVSPGGGAVFVTGASSPGHRGGTSFHDYATVAYNALTGAQRWASRYTTGPQTQSAARSLAVSPDGSKVIVTGTSETGYPVFSIDYATVAYQS